MKKDLESNIRRMTTGKMDRSPIKKGLPRRASGATGDLAIYHTPYGLKPFLKMAGEWHELATKSMIKDPIVRVMKPINFQQHVTTNGVSVIQAMYENTGFFAKDVSLLTPSILVNSKGGTGVLLQEDEGVLKVRDVTDSSDGDIRCANIRDANGNKCIEVKATSSAINRMTIKNAASGGTGIISMDGTEANIPVRLGGKGTGNIELVAEADGGVVNIIENTTIRFAFDPSTSGSAAEFRMLGSGTEIGLLDTDDDGLVRLWNMDALSSGSGGHIKISAADDVYLAAGGQDIWLYGGGTGQNGTTFDMGSVFGNFGVGGGSYLNHTATATSWGFLVDSNLSGTGASNGTGLQIDFDRTVAGSGTEAHNDIGINLDVNSASLGTSSVKGMDIDVVGATSGTHTAIGIDLDVDSADTNIGLNINTAGTHIKMEANADTNDYATIAVADTGDLTIATTGNGSEDSDLTLDVDGGIILDSVSGSVRVLADGSTFTPGHAADVVTKAYVDAIKHTAVWGGELARLAGSGTWLGIPTGHSLAALQMGTVSSPDTSYTVSTTADDLVACIWASMHDITVTGCKVWVGQGGATNTSHNVSLMRYDIDSDGDLSNGVEVGSGGSINNDDYSQARAYTMTLSGTAADLDVDFSDNQILIAFVEPTAAYNMYMAAKVILEYTEVDT